MSNVLPITMDQGSTLVHTFTLTTPVGTPFDLTGCDARMQVRRSYGDTTVLINCTLANSKLTLTDAVGGVLTLNLTPNDTSSIRFNAVDDEELEAVYDLELQTTTGVVPKIAKGPFTINREVTR